VPFFLISAMTRSTGTFADVSGSHGLHRSGSQPHLARMLAASAAVAAVAVSAHIITDGSSANGVVAVDNPDDEGPEVNNGGGYSMCPQGGKAQIEVSEVRGSATGTCHNHVAMTLCQGSIINPRWWNP